MNEDARCAEAAAKSNARGSQNLNRVVGSFDQDSGKLTWGARDAAPATGSVAPPALGEESWKWLYLQPLAAPRQ